MFLFISKPNYANNIIKLFIKISQQNMCTIYPLFLDNTSHAIWNT